MKKLIASFIFFLLFLLTFPLTINQLDHHLPLLVASEAKSSDQLAKEAWEYERIAISSSGIKTRVRNPLKLIHFDMPTFLRMGINGINPENNNLKETVKEKAPWETYDKLSEEVKTELKNLVQISNWEEKLKKLAEKSETNWKKYFWNKIRKKYFTYLKENRVDDFRWRYGAGGLNYITLLYHYDTDTLFEELRKVAIFNSLPNVYDNGWELTVREKINTATGKTLFADAKAIWENSIRSNYLAGLKKYQLKEIGGVKIASLLTLTSVSEFRDFTFQQQDEIHNLVDLANYQTLLATVVNLKNQAKIFWTNSANKTKIKQLLNYNLSTIDGVSLDQFTSNDLAKSFSELTTQQQEQLSQLIDLENYASKITTLLDEEEQAKIFWANAINKALLATLFQASLTTLGEVKIDQLNKDSLAKDYLTLTTKQKEQIRSLSKLTNFSQAVQQVVVKTKIKEKTNQLPLILGLGLGLSSLLLIIIFSYLYWKKQQKKTNKNSHK